MIDYTNCNIERISVHQIGNKNNGEDIYLSKRQLDISDPRLRELLLRFFLVSFTPSELYSFTFSDEDFTLNPLFNICDKVFKNEKPFHANSISIAKHLYDLSTHPQIKSGDLFVVYFSDLGINDELTDAIGIFKSENKQTFLKVNSVEGNFDMNYDDGINIEKMDKGCIVFNTEKESGYRVCVVDKSNKSVEAQYWKDNFINVRELNDDYHHTKQFMDIAKNFVTNHVLDEFELSKTDQIDFLNRSVEYFKTHDTFNKKQFEKEVFQDTDIIKSFKKFNSAYADSHDIILNDDFEIAPSAVKKQAKAFKNVLKLDKNFDIHIYGSRELIEQGVERDGRKYYKIYYREEY